MDEAIAALDACEYLFLRDLTELGAEGIRLVVEAGEPSSETTSAEIAGTVIPDCKVVESHALSGLWEVRWPSYVAYSVRNESFTTRDDSEKFTGHRFRRYSKSHFLDYVQQSTIATPDYPSVMHHIEVVCEDHVIDVVSVEQPVTIRLR
jgi:hypothetical protein